MKNRNIVPNEKECISQCIMQYWSSSSEPTRDRDAKYERCLTNCNICGSA
ncbi:hypothetical protein [Desulfosarcina ovata]|uniref:Uncharacterized protein n=1 Tax=Desulfosarcina ovata subsp. ovata TaxID=2752305 RepID=A0A5K8ABP6_9BACT|nr:hypothetical protein [Desulfosarcina ovata]BBO90133.1 hypothetical protein DSCOOX_33130 [Desulfosarcina ovata subsp. ovata]